MSTHKINLKICAQRLYFCLVTFHHIITVSRLKTTFVFQFLWCNTAYDFILGNFQEFPSVSQILTPVFGKQLLAEILTLYLSRKDVKTPYLFLHILHVFNLTFLHTTVFLIHSVFSMLLKSTKSTISSLGEALVENYLNHSFSDQNKTIPQCHY